MVNWLIVGVGDIVRRRVLSAILSEPRSRLHAVVTRDPAKTRDIDCIAYTDLDEALADPKMDAVYIATPVALHHPQTIAALRAGKHVLCEKPTAMSYPQAEEMAAVAEETGKTLGVAYYRRTYPAVQRARQLIADGVIGQPVLAELNCHGWFTLDTFHRSWLTDKSLAGGGPLFDIGSHRIDLANYLFGRPARVTGHLSNQVHQHEVEDNATVLIDYENSTRAVVDVRWHSKIDRDQCRVIGTHGAIDLSPLNSGHLDSPLGVEFHPPHANLQYPLIEDFVSAILEKRPPVCPIGDAILTDWVTAQVTRE